VANPIPAVDVWQHRSTQRQLCVGPGKLLHTLVYTLLTTLTVTLLGGLVSTQEHPYKDNSYQDKAKPGEPFEFAVPAGLETPSRYRLEVPFQEGPKCGPNALYVVLQILDIRCSYSEVLKSIPVSKDGSSLFDLQNCAHKFGLACEVRKGLSPDDIPALPMPVIVHLQGPAIAKSGRHISDHFAVIVGPDPQSPNQGFIGVDTTNGAVTRFTKAGFARSFSGYALVVTDRARSPRPSWLASIPIVSTPLFSVGAVLVLLSVIVCHGLCTTRRFTRRGNTLQ